MIAGGIERDRVFLERYHPERDRAEFEAAWKKMADETMRRRQSYEPHYEGSSVVMGPSGGVCSIHGKASPLAQPGHHLMPLQLSDGRNVFEALGQWYTLLALGAEPVDIEVLEDAARIEQVPLQVITDDAGDRRSEYGARLILVRPDQYVCWSGERSPDDPGAVMRAVAGAG